MSGFSAEWLRLREPCDARSRSEELVLAVRSRLSSRPLQALDLGSGTGANIRYMAPRLEGEQRWVAVDDEPAVLGQQVGALEGTNFRCSVSTRRLDLASGLDALPLSEFQLVTASALLDLVSESWLQSLASSCADARATVLFALTYDGRVQCQPREPDDEWIFGLVNKHQRGNKGFGPALGPDATSYARDVFGTFGFQSRVTASDWVIEPEEQSLQRELIAGWITAAHEMAPAEAERIELWARRRLTHLLAGTSRIRVGHQDFIAWPRAPGG